MPTISMFFGIVIRMYCGKFEHNPPHIHVYYQDFKAMFGVATAEMTEGNLPPRQTRLVTAWIGLNCIARNYLRIGHWRPRANILSRSNPCGELGYKG